jgi:catechol 2,3-dioxygenase-like lactoylglutathione lyase family enzyme
MNMKLEVVIVPVSDVDRAKAFYEKLGWRLDADFAADVLRVIQFTPPRSEASIIFGKGVTSAKPGSKGDLVLAVDDIDAARGHLIARGVKVSEVFHYAGLPFNDSTENTRVSGRDPEGRTYLTFASFEDPDGNGWLLQEVTTRLPGREWK